MAQFSAPKCICWGNSPLVRSLGPPGRHSGCLGRLGSRGVGAYAGRVARRVALCSGHGSILQHRVRGVTDSEEQKGGTGCQGYVARPGAPGAAGVPGARACIPCTPGIRVVVVVVAIFVAAVVAADVVAQARTPGRGAPGSCRQWLRSDVLGVTYRPNAPCADDDAPCACRAQIVSRGRRGRRQVVHVQLGAASTRY